MSNIFITVLNMSLTASYVALVVIFVRLLLKKAPKIYSYALWGIVLVRLILPFSLPSPLSLIPVETHSIPQDIAYSETPTINSGIEVIDRPVNQRIQSSLLPLTPAERVNPLGFLIEAAAIVWLLGIAGFLFYNGISYLKFKHLLSFATLVRGNIFETDRIQGPFVLGLIKPRIYIPTGLSGEELDYILKHEETHIRRRDHLIKPVTLLALILHWFNPIIWVSYFLMIKDMEMACDESVIKQSGEDIRCDYSYTLLALSKKQSGLVSLLSFGESNANSRIKNILNYKSPRLWVVVLALLLLAAVAAGLLTNPITVTRLGDIGMDEVEEIHFITSDGQSRMFEPDESTLLVSWYNSITDVSKVDSWSGTTDAPRILIITNPPEKGILITVSIDQAGYLHLQRSGEENYLGKHGDITKLLNSLQEGNVSEKEGLQPPTTSRVSFLGEPDLQLGIPVPDWAHVSGPLPENETIADWGEKWELYYGPESFYYNIGIFDELSWYKDHLPEYGWVKMGELSKRGNPQNSLVEQEGQISYGSLYYKEGSGYLTLTLVGDGIAGHGILLFTPQYPTEPFRDIWFEVWEPFLFKESEYLGVVGSRVAIRKTPGTTNKPADDVLERVSTGDTLELINNHDNNIKIDGYIWWEVYSLKTGIEGWVASEYLER